MSGGRARRRSRSKARLEELNRAWEAAGKSAFQMRIGLHVDETLVGNIGTPERFDYTVIGDPVNLASRLESLNKLYGTCILASEEVRREAGPGFEWRTLDRVAVVGRESATLVCELLGEAGTLAPAILQARDVYERALELYVAGRFEVAAAGFREAAALWPDDHAAVEMAERAEGLASEPVPGRLERGVRADLEAVVRHGTRVFFVAQTGRQESPHPPTPSPVRGRGGARWAGRGQPPSGSGAGGRVRLPTMAGSVPKVTRFIPVYTRFQT